MSKINTTVEFDYINRQYQATAIGTGSNWNSAATITILDPRGFEAAAISVSPNDSPALGLPRGHGTRTFDSDTFGNYSYIDTVTTQLHYVDISTMLHFSDALSLTGSGGLTGYPRSVYSGIIKAYETGVYPTYVRISQLDSVYSGVPLVIERGDSVPIYFVSGISGKNNLSYGSTQVISAALTGKNYANCIGEIVSGAHSGTQFHCVSYNMNSSVLVIDRDATAWSGEHFKLMPYRTITNYSGWEVYSGQAGGVQAMFTLDEAFPVGIASITSSAANVSTPTVDVGTAIGGAAASITVLATTATMPNLSYLYDVTYGDTVQYIEAGTLAVKYGTILSVDAPDALVPGFTTFTFYPTGTIAGAPNAGISIYRANKYKLLLDPSFDTNYTAVVQHGGETVDNYIVKTPRADLELTANEFDSTYANVGDVAHFHIGPIHLSNGQVIPQSYKLRYNINMYQGDVTSTVPVDTWTAHGTMSTDIGTVTEGSYMRRGMYTATYSQALNASETLMFDIVAGVGGAKIQKIISIPVQPSA